MKIRFALLALCTFLMAQLPHAQTTFTVTTETKTATHPYFGQGHPDGYVIDGVEANEITLIRGETYAFQMEDISPIHPFYISTDDAGAGVGEWTEGVTGSGATGSQTLTFEVPPSAPDLLYYQCFVHQFMGWKINVVDPVSVTDETPGPGFSLSIAYPNPSNDRITVGMTLDRTRDVTVEVFDASGRRVAVLSEGVLAAGDDYQFVFGDENLPAGVYLVRATAGEASVERRVTLVR